MIRSDRPSLFRSPIATLLAPRTLIGEPSAGTSTGGPAIAIMPPAVSTRAERTKILRRIAPPLSERPGLRIEHAGCDYDIERPALDVGRSGRAITRIRGQLRVKVPIFSQAWAGERQITPDQSPSVYEGNAYDSSCALSWLRA